MHGVLVAVLVTGMFSSAGCSSAKPEPNDSDRMTRAVLGIVAEFYADFLQSHHGKPPQDNADFHKYLASRAEDLKLYNVESPDQLHSSHRDERPLVIISGRIVAPPDSPDSPWAAHEQKGIDGKRLAVRVRGGIHELSEDEIAEIFESN